MFLHIPFFILLNPQDSSYEIIHDNVSLEGVANVSFLFSNIFRILMVIHIYQDLPFRMF